MSNDEPALTDTTPDATDAHADWCVRRDGGACNCGRARNEQLLGLAAVGVVDTALAALTGLPPPSAPAGLPTGAQARRLREAAPPGPYTASYVSEGSSTVRNRHVAVARLFGPGHEEAASLLAASYTLTLAVGHYERLYELSLYKELDLQRRVAMMRLAAEGYPELPLKTTEEVDASAARGELWRCIVDPVSEHPALCADHMTPEHAHEHAASLKDFEAAVTRRLGRKPLRVRWWRLDARGAVLLEDPAEAPAPLPPRPAGLITGVEARKLREEAREFYQSLRAVGEDVILVEGDGKPRVNEPPVAECPHGGVARLFAAAPALARTVEYLAAVLTLEPKDP